MARQQVILLQTAFGKAYGMQHQPAPVTPVHITGGDETEEEQRRRAACGEGLPAPGGATSSLQRILFSGCFCAWDAWE